ncbi:MAG: M48 family metallopeptidase [Lysobacter sp.]|nr:M48 family metallopeptidase [Lysobacter sp.]
MASSSISTRLTGCLIGLSTLPAGVCRELPLSETRCLGLGGEESLTYTLRRTSRRRSVGIFVEPDGRLSILAPTAAPTERVEQILRRRLNWIRRQQREVEALPPPPLTREWVAGETHRYLGRQYRLKLVRAPERSVKLLGGYFVVSVSDKKDRDMVRTLVESWYREHAKTLLNHRVERMIASTSWLDIRSPPLQIRTLRQCWGSTTKTGRISFNIDLIKLPLSCIDYVVAHELVHLLIPNHSPAFWRMLDRVMPDWRRWRNSLRRAEM